jgi:hypothetical protein
MAVSKCDHASISVSQWEKGKYRPGGKERGRLIILDGDNWTECQPIKANLHDNDAQPWMHPPITVPICVM